MTPAKRDLLLAYALQWQRFATEAAAAALSMANLGAPVERCRKATAIARCALELAIELDELARDAAPMAGAE